MAPDKRPVILIAHSNLVEGANLAKQVEDYFYSTYRIQTVSTNRDATEISRSLHDSSGPNLVAALIDERLDNGLGQDFLRDANAVLPDEGRLLLTQQPAANHDDGIQRITLSSDGVATFNEEFQRALEHMLYKTAPSQRFTVVVTGRREIREVITLMRFLRLNAVPYSQEESTPPSPIKVVVTLRNPTGGMENLNDPTLIELSTKLDLVRIAKPGAGGKYECDVAVVGGGAAGISAAVNLVSLYGKSPLIIEEFAPGGGAVATANNIIDNYLGFPDGIQVAELAARWKQQADKYKIDWLPCYRVTNVDHALTGDYPFTLTLALNNKDRDQLNSLVGDEDKQVAAKKVLLACGIKVRKQGGKDEEKYAGQGVYYSALTGDAAFYHSNDNVAIIGGGDTAGIAAIFFAQASIKTTMIIRGKLRDSMLEGNYSQIEALKGLIKVEEGAEVVTYKGANEYLNKLEIKQTGQPNRDIDVAAAYVLIGAQGLDETTKGWLTTLKVPFDNVGVKTISPAGSLPFFNMTNVPGLFVAGDARAGSARRIIAAVGDGGSAALGIYNDFISKKLSPGTAT